MSRRRESGRGRTGRREVEQDQAGVRGNSPFSAWSRSLYDLIGAAEDRSRDRQAERPGSLEIDDKLEIGRLLDRQIGRLGALEDLSDDVPTRRKAAVRLDA
jgi:hypothetical protein